LIAVYVDDMLIIGSRTEVEISEKMLSNLYDIKHLGAARDRLLQYPNTFDYSCERKPFRFAVFMSACSS